MGVSSSSGFDSTTYFSKRNRNWKFGLFVIYLYQGYKQEKYSIFSESLPESLECLFAAWISGLVQTLLYADFFYYYFQRLIELLFSSIYLCKFLVYLSFKHFKIVPCSWKNNQKLHLPA